MTSEGVFMLGKQDPDLIAADVRLVTCKENSDLVLDNSNPDRMAPYPISRYHSIKKPERKKKEGNSVRMN
jgi:hypothetical protein